MRLVSYIFCLFILSSCSAGENKIEVGEREDQDSPPMSQAEINKAKKEVRTMMLDYQDAMDSFDTERLLSYFEDSPDFVYTRAGKRRNYEDFKKGSGELSTHFKKLEIFIDTVYVDLITPNVAISSVPYAETLTNHEDEEREISGTFSWIAVKKKGKWQFTHGHSFKEI